MKQPRTSDFDPNAQRHSLKSSMASMPVIEKPPASPPVLTQAPVPKAASDKPSVGTTRNQSIPALSRESTKAPAAETIGKENKRKLKTRQPFDVYQDQVDALRRLAFEEKMQGGTGSMSAMVREALDAYLDGRKRQGNN